VRFEVLTEARMMEVRLVGRYQSLDKHTVFTFRAEDGFKHWYLDRVTAQSNSIVNPKHC
jgi:hypothetical protein